MSSGEEVSMTVPKRDQGLLKLKVAEPDRAQLRHRRRKWFLTGWREEPPPSRLGTVEDPDRDAVGI